jgi:YidC/Oxa1 family membrane protein insertase
MKYLAHLLLLLLDFLMRFAPPGIAIILLSVCVKILMAPLIIIAERWQKQVNRTKTIMQPVLDEINRKSRGEERNRLTLEAYKEHKVHPLYTVKSLFSALIQIPIFFAAYHMLAENPALKGASFLWINNLALPDSLFVLPVSIPFFGSNFNLLPFLMTSFTLLSSWIFFDRSLSAVLLKKQRRNLYLMAAFFFVLFYNFPAGMVLYWTTNNVLALIKTLAERALVATGKGIGKRKNSKFRTGIQDYG